MDSHGDVLILGNIKSADGNGDIYTAKYAGADGALLWEQRYNGPANNDDNGVGLALDSNGNVVVSGMLTSPYPTPDTAP